MSESPPPPAPPASPAPRARVAIANRSDGGVLFWVGRLYGFVALVGLTLWALSALAGYGYFARSTAAA